MVGADTIPNPLIQRREQAPILAFKMILPPTHENFVRLGDDSGQCTVALLTPRRVSNLLVEIEERLASHSNIPFLEPKSQEVKAFLEAAHRSLRLRQLRYI